MLDIEVLRAASKLGKIVITEHARQRLVERRITSADIKTCILNGEIIKQYEDDKPFPSCLLLGISIENKGIHVVVSYDGEFVHIITAYYPDATIWSEDFKNRKGR